MKIQQLKKIAESQKKNNYVLKICLLGLYSEWEGAIKSKIEELIKECNKYNQSKYKLKKEYFLSNRNLNNDQLRHLWKTIFKEDFDRIIKNEGIKTIDGTFFTLRNIFAHGELSNRVLEWKKLQEYFVQVVAVADLFSDRVDEFITKKEYLENS